MNKAELIEALAQHYDGSKAEATRALNAVVQTITYSAAAGEKVAITGFGVFEKLDRPARTVRNPRTGERKEAPATSVPRFRPGTELKAYVAGERPLPDPATQVPAAAAAPAPARRRATSRNGSDPSPAAAPAAAVEPVAAEPAPAEVSAPPAPAKSAGKGKGAAKAKAAAKDAAAAPAKVKETAKAKAKGKGGKAAVSAKDSGSATKKDAKKKDGKKAKSGK